jgi:hypothetical protein
VKILRRQTLWTLVTLLLLGGAGHYFLGAYQGHRFQQDRLERIRFRQDFVNRQIAELQEKIRVIEQVNAFTGGAEDLGLVPSNWTRYEVDIEAPLQFAALAEILRQCRSTPYYYFQPQRLKVHLAGPSGGAETADGTAMDLSESVAASDGSGETGDLFLQLKGTFLARRR